MKKIFCSLFLVASLLCSCASKEESPADIPQATERGQNDARALLTLDSENISEVHSALLSVKAREWEMRRNGDNASADAYIDAFKQYVVDQNKKLADEIF